MLDQSMGNLINYLRGGSENAKPASIGNGSNEGGAGDVRAHGRLHYACFQAQDATPVGPHCLIDACFNLQSANDPLL